MYGEFVVFVDSLKLTCLCQNRAVLVTKLSAGWLLMRRHWQATQRWFFMPLMRLRKGEKHILKDDVQISQNLKDSLES